MTQEEVGKLLVQFGSGLLALPCLLIFLILTLYFISLIEFTVVTLVIIGCLIYLAISIGLIIYGNKLMREENDW